MVFKKLRCLVVFSAAAVVGGWVSPSLGNQKVFAKRIQLAAKEKQEAQDVSGFSVSNIHWTWRSYPGGGVSEPCLIFSLRNESGKRIWSVALQIKFYDRKGKELHTEPYSFSQEMGPDSSSLVKVPFDEDVGFFLKRASKRQKVVIESYRDTNRRPNILDDDAKLEPFF